MLSFFKRGCSMVHVSGRLTTSSAIGQGQYSTSKNQLPEPPKKPSSSSYISFVRREFANIQKENPNLTKSKDVIKALSVRWHNLDYNEKQKYITEGRDDYEEKRRSYERSHAEFMSNLTSEQKAIFEDRTRVRKLARLKKEILFVEDSFNKPRRVPSATALYAHSISEADPTAKIRLVDMIAKWNTLPEEEKQRFRDLRAEKMKEYQQNMVLYERRLGEEIENYQRLERLKEKYAALLKQRRQPNVE